MLVQLLIPQLRQILKLLSNKFSDSNDAGNNDGEVLTISTAGLTGITSVANIASSGWCYF